jgi:hypothetical protein
MRDLLKHQHYLFKEENLIFLVRGDPYDKKNFGKNYFFFFFLFSSTYHQDNQLQNQMPFEKLHKFKS